jgi:ABC-2 type transport system permease protein
MKKRKFFDWNYYKEALRQLRTVGVTMGVIYLLQSTLVPLWCYVNLHQIVSSGNNELLRQIPFWEVAPALALIVFLMPMMANILFDFLHKRNASDFYHSLPVRRETMYISNLAAIATWCLALFVIPALVETALFTIMPHVELTWEHFWYILADVYVLGLILTAALLLAKNLAGNRFGISMVMLMILFLPRLYLLSIEAMVEVLHPYIVLGSDHHLLWDCSWNLLFGIYENPFSRDSLIYTLILAILYLVVAGILFVRRKSEKAEDASIGKRMQLVFRLLPALTFSLIPLAYILNLIKKGEGADSTDLVLLVVLYVVAVVIYLLYELFTTKKLSAVAKSFKGLIWLVVGNVVLFGGISIYSNIQGQILPTAEEVRSVQIYSTSWNATLLAGESRNEYYFVDKFLVDWKIQDPDVIAAVLDILETNIQTNDPYSENCRINVKINTASGTLDRALGVGDVSALRRALEDVLLEEHFEEVFTEPVAGSYSLIVYYTAPVSANDYDEDYWNYIGLDYEVDSNQIHVSDSTGRALYEQWLEEFKAADADTRYQLLTHDEDTTGMALQVELPLKSVDHLPLTMVLDPVETPKTWEMANKLGY